MNTKTISFCLPLENYNLLEERLQTLKMNRSQYLNNLIASDLSNNTLYNKQELCKLTFNLAYAINAIQQEVEIDLTEIIKWGNEICRTL